MKIKLLNAVIHNGHRAEAGHVDDIDAAVALGWIASGAAVAVEEPQPANDAGNAGPKELEPLIQPEAGQPADAKPAAIGAAPTPDPKTADTETKAAKAKEGK